MHSEKISTVASMPGEDRVSYLVRKTADFEETWGLEENGWAMASNDAGVPALPVWPEREFAEACCDGKWAGATAKAIPLDEFIEKWVPGLTRDHRLLCVFPTSSNAGVFMKPDELKSYLQEKLDQYE